jgi:hypothetical protein
MIRKIKAMQVNVKQNSRGPQDCRKNDRRGRRILIAGCKTVDMQKRF